MSPGQAGIAAFAVATLCGSSDLSTIATATEPTWTRHPQMGRCFADVSSFIEVIAGPLGALDENIQRSATGLPTDGSVWVIDQTPQTNHQWYLLQPDHGGELCMTLFVFAAAQVAFDTKDDQHIVFSKTQASPGFPAKEVRFLRVPGDRVFRAVDCVELWPADPAPSRRVVFCDGFFE